MDLLRLITAGSVDDGKSTLIGRLLYDSRSVLIDQLEAIERHSRSKTVAGPDLALLTDGLRAEREQGITIDVAYKYFETSKRKFILADAPGHIQYTRNMVTGASNANLIIILIDARQGVVEQTRRHSIIASLLRIPHVVVAINKMDLVEHSEQVFNNIVNAFSEVADSLNLPDITYVPISALLGDNIVDASQQMPWYDGLPLLSLLENIPLQNDTNLTDARFPVQYVIRPQTENLHDYRGYAGKIISGIYKTGDAVTILPSGNTSIISLIEKDGQPVEEAFAPQSVIFHLQDDVDVSRGDMIVLQHNGPQVQNEIEVLTCWMDTKLLQPNGRFILQLHSRTVRCVVKEIVYRLDVNSLQKELAPEKALLNDIVRLRIRTAAPVMFDAYADNSANGGAILIDETSFLTAGACIIQ